MKKEYGTATFEEIREGFVIATAIAGKIHTLPNPAIQNMIKELIALIYVHPMDVVK